MQVYVELLEEAKPRMACIDGILNGRLLPSPLLREIAFLQFRMLCESIALGCLVVHGDIGETQIGNLRKEWSASKIMERLGSLADDFYPHPGSD
jgi:hypothetical protein